MKRDWQQRWAKAYDRARARTRRRVNALIDEIVTGPSSEARREDDDTMRQLHQLVGEADRFEDRVHGLLLKQPPTEHRPIRSAGGPR